MAYGPMTVRQAVYMLRLSPMEERVYLHMVARKATNRQIWFKPRDIAKEFGISGSQASQQLVRLEEKGLVDCDGTASKKKWKVHQNQ